MTVEEAREEKDIGVIILYHATANYAEIDDITPTFDPRFLPTPIATTDKPNLKDDMAAWCVDTIIQDQDLMAAHIRIK